MFGREYSLLAGSFMDCTVSIVRQLAEGVFFPIVIILDYGHCEKLFIYFNFSLMILFVLQT
jgi:hypothetical protein